MHVASGTFIPELPNNQASSLHPQDNAVNDQRHEFPAQQMAHAQELPLGQFDPRYELPVAGGVVRGQSGWG